jgi:hypothetical protein
MVGFVQIAREPVYLEATEDCECCANFTVESKEKVVFFECMVGKSGEDPTSVYSAIVRMEPFPNLRVERFQTFVVRFVPRLV